MEKEWITDANKAVELQLVSPSQSLSFHPTTSYQIFGQEELIYGYKDLKLTIAYTSGSLYSYLGFKYTQKTSDPDDVVTILNKVLKQDTFSYDEFRNQVVQDQSFKPMGEKVHEYTHKESKYEYYKCDFLTRRFREYHDRLKSFLFWFIEGASDIDCNDDRWEIMLAFLVRDGVYELVGYTTYYPFFHYPNMVRMRISQFLILPPFQHQGHGKKLYAFLYETFRRDPRVIDITVEDPNDHFQDMRDCVDVGNLLNHNVLKDVPFEDITKETYERLYNDFKLCKKQLERCVEIILLYRLKKWDAQAVKQYRLFVKKRLYIKNRDVLEEMDFGQRLHKLQQTFEMVEADYLEILDKL